MISTRLPGQVEVEASLCMPSYTFQGLGYAHIIGQLAIVVPDLRSERTEQRVMKAESHQAFERFLENIASRNKHADPCYKVWNGACGCASSLLLLPGQAPLSAYHCSHHVQ